MTKTRDHPQMNLISNDKYPALFHLSFHAVSHVCIIYHEAARTFPVHVHFFCIDYDDNFQLEWCSDIKIFRFMVVVGLTSTC